jgi:hypothetical protein
MATIKSLIIWSLILALVGLIECKKKKPLPGQPGKSGSKSPLFILCAIFDLVFERPPPAGAGGVCKY